MAKQVIPTSGLWSSITSKLNGNFNDLYKASSAEIVLDGQDFTDITPTGLGSAGAVVVTYGAAQNTGSDPVMMDANGLITFNEGDTYWLSFYFQFGRSTSSGTSHLVLRNLVNGFPAGSPIAAKAINSAVLIPSEFHIPLTVPAGTTLQGQIMRDSSGTNNGGLVTYAVDETADNWSVLNAPSTRIIVYRIRSQT
jgi:hypothetical protein